MTFIYSMWDGYWSEDSTIAKLLEKCNIQKIHIHCSGHASTTDLETAINTINALKVIPIHTDNPEYFKNNIDKVQLLDDGQLLAI